MERPRKVGAKYRNQLLIPSPDKIRKNVEEGYAAKRDHWKDFDSTRMNNQVVETYEAQEKARLSFLGRRLLAADNEDFDSHFEQTPQRHVPPASFRNRRTLPSTFSTLTQTRILMTIFTLRLKRTILAKSYKVFSENLKKEVERYWKIDEIDHVRDKEIKKDLEN
ncbi:unnamed protein product [Microthlaspi erraticum]|uniref:Pre-mRNA-splicing factor SLU7 n=1 Tax=Microthlaspi erraticum TaxID=1685480 RepID=A0A6D2KRV2_9BRAS|nr:unnamed protein product [Microthlaspi erraticum]